MAKSSKKPTKKVAKRVSKKVAKKVAKKAPAKKVARKVTKAAGKEAKSSNGKRHRSPNFEADGLSIRGFKDMQRANSPTQLSGMKWITINADADHAVLLETLKRLVDKKDAALVRFLKKHTK